MTHRRAKNALVQVLAADPLSFPEGLREIPETLRNLIDVEDPDFEFIVAAIRTFRLSGLDVEDEAVLRLAVQAGHRRGAKFDEQMCSGEFDKRREQAERDRQARADAREVKAQVYYARISDRVKIGFTTNLAKRMSNINPEELLAIEPGGPMVEAERHRQFAHLRVHGEWFRYEGALAEHVAGLRAQASASGVGQR